MNEVKCPKCGSTNTYRSKKFNAWICEDCDEKFNLSVERADWNSGLQSADFWCIEFGQSAPASLSHSYNQLMHYVEVGNIGCTLFLIRDVFELMIKIPIVILFDSIYSLMESMEDFKGQFEREPKLEALYRNSMQLLSTGKWWECVRLGAGLSLDAIDLNGLDEYRSAVLADTLSYLKQVYRLFEFRIPGKQKVNMVTWRNRAVGHSCLASKPEESYPEIPYILKMFKNVAEVSLPYYRKVCFANNNKELLIGMNFDVEVKQVFIAYKTNGGCHYFRIHDFAAGRKDSMSYYDGYEKGKAYLLDYGDGERYKAVELSKFIMSAKSELDNAIGVSSIASSADINEDNLETADIQQLEAQLSGEKQIVYVDFLYQWLTHQVKNNVSGIFLLQAERGMGKSTFCRTIDQLSKSENVRWFSDDVDGWSEFMESAAVRVWHFNSSYYGRKDIYLKGIRDALLTMEPGYMENGVWSEPNRLVGNLDSIWGNLNECAEDLRKVYFAEALNLTASEYFKRTNKNKLVLVLDGVDEIRDYSELISYIPAPATLNSNVYIVLTCRTNDEIKSELKNNFSSGMYTSKLVFKRNEITEYGYSVQVTAKNETYSHAVELYTENAIANLNVHLSLEASEILDHFESRFSDLTAYFSLCQMNQQFCELSNTELLSAFLEAIRSNSTNAYYSRMMLILNTMAWCGDSLTLRELAFLSGEGYVSYRFLGILNDLRAFIKVTRTSRGNCYEFSHNEWEESVKKQFPFGGIEFRMRCDRLLDNLEELRKENRAADILQEEYEGERWLFTNMLSIYIRDWIELKDNWFENIQLSNISAFTYELLKNRNIKNMTMISQLPLLEIGRNSMQVEKSLERDSSVGLSHIFEEEKQCYLLETIAEFYELFSWTSDDNIRLNRLIESGDTFHTLGFEESDQQKADFHYQRSLQLYKSALDACEDEADINVRLMLTYKLGRAYQFRNQLEEAYSCFCQYISRISSYDHLDTVSLDSKENLCRAFIRCGNIADKILENDDEKQLNYYLAARYEAQNLVTLSQAHQYLETLIWCDECLGSYYGKIGNIADAIYYRKQAMETYEMIPKEKRSIQNINGMRKNYERLGDLYAEVNQYQEAFACLEKVLDLDIILDDKPSEAILEKLIQASSMLENSKKSDEYKAMKAELYKPMNEAYRKAFQEVYIIYEHMPETLQRKIPESFVSIMESNRDRDHQLIIDENEDFLDALDDSHLSHETMTILSLIYADFLLDEGEEKKKLHKRDEVKLLVSNMQDVHRLTTGIKMRFSKAYSWEEIQCLPDFNDSCTEVWQLLEGLPRDVVLRIPIEVLMLIKKSRNERYVYNGKISKVKDTTRRSFKYLLSTFIPDFEKLIHSYENIER